MRASFLLEARMEMMGAAQFYEQKKAGLGSSFLELVARAVDDVERYPRRWPALGKGVRRRLIGRFPYGILYRVGRDEITIIAVMHLHRDPGYWRKRV
jgi:plasmid stabilization system protein ParE